MRLLLIVIIFLNTKVFANEQIYQQAKQALNNNRYEEYINLAKQMPNYILAPTLQAEFLYKTINQQPANNIENFLNRYFDTFNSQKLRLAYLKQSVLKGDFSTFAKFYREDDNSSENDCFYYDYLFNNNKISANVVFDKLQNPNQAINCGNLLAILGQRKAISDNLIYERIVKALAINYISFAKNAQNAFSNDYYHLTQNLLNVATNPGSISNIEQTLSLPNASAIATIGIIHLYKSNKEQALSLLGNYKQRLKFEPYQRHLIAKQILIPLARGLDGRSYYLLDEFAANSDDEELVSWHLRVLLRENAWAKIYKLMNSLPNNLKEKAKFQYYLARSIEVLHPAQSSLTRQIYKNLSYKRDFYGFLAADKIGASYNLNHNAIAIDNNILNKAKQREFVARVAEYYRLNDTKAARFEHYHAIRFVPENELLTQAYLANQNQWYFLGIRALGKANYLDDLNVRFPLPYYASNITSVANNFSVPGSFAMAITRQESAFLADVTSSSGAMGLMQLMPATAKEVARKYNIPLSHHTEAYEPSINMQLGSAYLGQMLKSFNNNRAFAAAAYNAGPGRVRGWLRTNADKNMPIDSWIETIPFDETRNYVTNVLTYAVIYGQKLGQNQKVLTSSEYKIPQVK